MRPRLVAFARASALRFVELEGMDRAMALAGQAFAALLPLLIVVGALAPAGGRDLAAELIERFELTGSAAASVRAAVAQPPDVLGGVSLLSGALVVIYALAFTRALQRLYAKAWRLRTPVLRDNAWGLAWLGAFALYWGVQPVVTGLLSGPAAVATSLGLSTGLWLATPYLLVGRRVAWRRLLPQALVTAAAFAAFGIGSAIYMPHAVGDAAGDFGVIGVAFALLSWLFGGAVVLVACAAIGAALPDVFARTAPAP